MYRIFDIAAEEQHEQVLMLWPDGSDLFRTLHKLGLEYAMSPEGAAECRDGLTFGTLLKYLTPEMLAPYGIKMLWLSREAIKTYGSTPVVSQYELESYAEARERENIRERNWERRLKETSERFALRLERLKADAHPVVSTWDASRISGRAVSWAYQYIKAGGLDADGFFAKKLDEAKPCKGKVPAAVVGANQQNFIQPA